MRKFILQLALFFAILLILLGALLWPCLTIPARSLSADDYNLALLDKIARLETTVGQPRRLILVGGSNVAFGMDSERIERETGLTVVNMGLNVGLGLGYALAIIEPFLRNGDTVVLVPEYGNFTDDWNGDFNRFAVTIDVQKKSPLTLYRRGLYGWPRECVEYLRWKAFGFLRQGKVFTDGKLRRSLFNRQGDYVGHLGEPGRRFPASRRRDASEVDPTAMTRLSGFIAEVKRTRPGVSFAVVFPSFEAESYDHQKLAIDAIAQGLSGLDLAILSPPEASRWERHLFYDSAYHLNREGRQLQTGQFIQNLRNHDAMRGLMAEPDCSGAVMPADTTRLPIPGPGA